MTPNRTPSAPGEPSLTSMPCVVLDTNVALDWLLFDDPSLGALAAAVTAHRVRWLATAAMRGELEHVLHGGLASSRGRDTKRLLQAWDRHVSLQPPPPTHRTLRCRDPDDQLFVDLALGTGARWLVSRDRAVLALRRRAVPLGLFIVPPVDWHRE